MEKALSDRIGTYRGDTIILHVFVRMRKAEDVETTFEVSKNLPGGPVLLQ